MENATKALLIAAAILVAILIISLALVVYRMASDTVSNANLSEAQKATHNGKFETYMGDHISGSQLNAIIRTVRSHNKIEEDAGTNRFVKVFDNNMDDPGTGKALKILDKGTDLGYIYPADKYYRVRPEYYKGIIYKIDFIDAGKKFSGET